MGRRAKKKAARGTKRAKVRERDTVSVRGVRMGLVVKWMKAHITEQARTAQSLLRGDQLLGGSEA